MIFSRYGWVKKLANDVEVVWDECLNKEMKLKIF